ncbi:MAG TPA: hypothetical protein VFY25_04235 [Anaerolineales bacterium]|nr:hypothetical protein [Anaerolineales bacterium]
MKLFQSKLSALFAVAAMVALLLAASGAAPAPAQKVSEPIHSEMVSHGSRLISAETSSQVNVPDFDQMASNNTKIDPLVFQQAVRKLWEDHVTWTRVYIIAALADLPEADIAAQRLLQNQVDIGDAVKPFYGDEAGEQLTALLSDHILIAADLLTAAKAGDTAGFEDANKRWYENADDIAAFLHSANPGNWPLTEMQMMMKDHLDLTLEEASARLNEDWAGDVAAYDKVHTEILHMADMISDGIIKQFPKEFAKQKASQAEIGLTLAMDNLWEDHVTWTRIYIMSVTSELPDADAAAGRLLQNQVDIGNAIKPFYGDEAGEQLTFLLNDHILIAADLLTAAKAGDTAGFEDANKRWYKNADEIAAFLNSANPKHWPLAEMQSMMSMHLDLTLEEASARLNSDWAGDVAAYDKVHEEILEMSHMLTEGIVAQFPNEFK